MSKELAWLKGEIKTPPFSEEARKESGEYLRLLQDGYLLSMPISRPMPSIGPHVHELRIRDEQENWRIIYRIDVDAIVIAEVFPKKTEETPMRIINACKKRFAEYDND